MWYYSSHWFFKAIFPLFAITVHPSLDLMNEAHQTPFCSLYRIIHYIKCYMLSKSSNWGLGLVHYIAKFTISMFVISRFECTTICITRIFSCHCVCVKGLPFVLGIKITITIWSVSVVFGLCIGCLKWQLTLWRFLIYAIFSSSSDSISYS